MKTFSLHLSYLISLLVLLLGGASIALAQAPTVVFEETPLFLDANIEPGDSVARTVTITNSGTETHELYVASANVFSTGLGEVMELAVTTPGTTYFTGDFDAFFADTPLALGTLASGETKVVTFSAMLPSGTGNAYQTKQLGFDLVIGFVGGGTVTDNPGGGGGGGGSSVLRIFNEEVESVVGSTATLSWNTNLNASTYLVCGVVSGTPFTLTAVAPLFGYQFTLPEADTDTKVHTAALTGLDIGTYECRPAGRVSPSKPFTVGEALQFSIGPEGLVAGAATSLPTVGGLLGAPTGSVLGASGKGTFGGPTYDEWKAEEDALRAARASSTDTGATTENAFNTVAGADQESENTGASTGVIGQISWLWLFLAAVLMTGGWYWRRLARN